MRGKAIFLFILLFSLIFAVGGFAQIQRRKPFPSHTQRRAPTTPHLRGTPHPAIHNGQAPSKPTASSDLSIERIYLKGCVVYVTLANKGKGTVSLKDYQNGKLCVSYNFTTETSAGVKPHSFSLRQVDPKGVLSKPQGRIDFNTGIKAQNAEFTIDAKLERLKDDLYPGKGKKELKKSFTSPTACLQKSSFKKASKQTPSSHLSKNTGKFSKSGIARQGPSSQDLERGRQMEMAEKMKRQQTLEEAKGQRAFEAERESRGAWEEHKFESSGKGRRGTQGPIKEEGLFGESRDQGRFNIEERVRRESIGMREGPTTPSGQPMGARYEAGTSTGFGETVGESPHKYGYETWTGYAQATEKYARNYLKDPNDHKNAAGYYIFMGYAYQKEGNSEKAKESYSMAAEHIKDWTGADGVIVDVTNSGKVTITIVWKNNNNKEEQQDNNEGMPRQPEESYVHEGRQESPAEKAEKTDREFTPHAEDIYHYTYEKRKKESESSGGSQVNPGSNIVGQTGRIVQSNQGAKTVWKLQVWATDPDFANKLKNALGNLKNQMRAQ